MNQTSMCARAGLLFILVLGAPAQAEAPRNVDAEPPEFAGMVEAHNRVRREVGVAPLTWSGAAARQAQAWADQLARENCALRYNPDPARRETFGENVLRASANRPYAGFKRQSADVVKRWVEESAWYDQGSNGCFAPPGRICGSYLQVVWDETQVIGCGRARCDAAEVWVCNYTPRGNKVERRPYGEAAAPPPPPAEVLECPAEPDTAPEGNEAPLP